MAKVKMYKCINCGNLNTHKDSYDDDYCYDCVDIDTGKLKENIPLKESHKSNNIKERILATNGIGNGLLPMKESKEQEKQKTDDQKNTELCNFIKNAFCIDGDVEMVLSNQAIVSRIFFRCNDSKRGKFWVANGQLNDAVEKEGEEK